MHKNKCHQTTFAFVNCCSCANIISKVHWCKIAGGNFICVFKSFEQFKNGQLKLNWKSRRVNMYKPQTQTILNILGCQRNLQVKQLGIGLEKNAMINNGRSYLGASKNCLFLNKSVFHVESSAIIFTKGIPMWQNALSITNERNTLINLWLVIVRTKQTYDATAGGCLFSLWAIFLWLDCVVCGCMTRKTAAILVSEVCAL